MLPFLDALPLWALGAFMVAVSIAFGLTMSATAHRAGWTLDTDDIDSGTVLHALTGLVYAVVLGLIVVNVQEDHTAVRQSTIAEAGALGDVYDALEGVDPLRRAALQGHIRRYLDIVVNDEWPALRRGEGSQQAEDELRALVTGVITLDEQQRGSQAVQQTLLNELDSAIDARRSRIFVGLRGINRGTWAVVILGAMIVIGFAALFPLRARGRVAVVGMTASIFGLMLFLIVATSRPLRGQLGVAPAAFMELAADLDRR